MEKTTSMLSNNPREMMPDISTKKMPPKPRKRRTRKAMLKNVPQICALIDKQVEIFRLCEQVAILKSETDIFRKDNKWLYEQLKQMRKDNENYLNYCRTRAQDKIAELNELGKRHVRMSREMMMLGGTEEAKERALLITLADRKEERQKTAWVLLEALSLADAGSKLLQDSEFYKATVRENSHTIMRLQAELDELKEKQDQETRELKNQFIRDRREVKRCQQLNLRVVNDNIGKYSKRTLVHSLRKFRDINNEAQDYRLTTMQKKNALEAKRDKLVQAKEAMQRDRDYWADMNSIRKPSWNHEAARRSVRSRLVVADNEAARHRLVVDDHDASKEDPTSTTSGEQLQLDMLLKVSYSQTILNTAFVESGMRGSELVDHVNKLHTKRHEPKGQLGDHLKGIDK